MDIKIYIFPFVLEFYLTLPNMGHNMNNYWNLLHSSPISTGTTEQYKTVAYECRRNLKGCTARQCSLYMRKFMECFIPITYDETSSYWSAQKAPNFSAFH